jgi:hypothetical protein
MVGDKRMTIWGGVQVWDAWYSSEGGVIVGANSLVWVGSGRGRLFILAMWCIVLYVFFYAYYVVGQKIIHPLQRGYY